MSNRREQLDLPVTFAGLEAGEESPRIAAYQLDNSGRPVKKLGAHDGKTLKVDLSDARSIALGPDVEDFKTLPKESLVSYRVAQNRPLARAGHCLAARSLESFAFSSRLRQWDRTEVPPMVLGSA